MRVLFDQGVPFPISRYLTRHTVDVSADLGGDRLRNGELLIAAEQAGYDVLLTTDKNLRYQQNLKVRRIGIIVIGHAQWPTLKLHVAARESPWAFCVAAPRCRVVQAPLSRAHRTRARKGVVVDGIMKTPTKTMS